MNFKFIIFLILFVFINLYGFAKDYNIYVNKLKTNQIKENQKYTLIIKEYFKYYLSQIEGVNIIERENFNAIFEIEELEKIFKNQKTSKKINFYYILEGKFYKINNQFIISASLIQLQNLKVICNYRVEKNNFMETVHSLSLKLKKFLLQNNNKKLIYDKDNKNEKKLKSEFYYLKGLIDYNLKKYNTAIYKFILSKKYRENNSPSIYYIGLCYYNLNMKKHAQIEFNKIIKDYKNSVYYDRIMQNKKKYLE